MMRFNYGMRVEFMTSVGIVGGTGYTGVELMRILAKHPQIEIKVVTSRKEAGKSVASVYPNLTCAIDLFFEHPEVDALKKCDCVFFAAPNGTAMHMVPELLEKGVKVIDLAADFRIKDVATWEHWYKQRHACPSLIKSAIYGLPELYREQIRQANLVANPGCYPTAVTLGFLPLLESGLIKNSKLIADAKSGVSGAGRGTSVPLLFSEAGENFKAYNVMAHRHWPEIKQQLDYVSNSEVDFTFTPHLVPMVRGIFATLYITDLDRSVDLISLYKERFANEYYVTVLDNKSLPETKHVRSSNFCMLSVQQSNDSDTVIVLSVIDNLVKGAAGQAVQNMNLMFGFEETLGLDYIGLYP